MSNRRPVILAHAFDKRGRLLAVATNSYTKTHPLQAYFAKKVGHPAKQFLHAELACILRCKDQQIHTLRIFRYGANGELACAKPCPICQEAIVAYGIPNIWYSDNNTMAKLYTDK
jgi:deoxycytidylate deaminase